MNKLCSYAISSVAFGIISIIATFINGRIFLGFICGILAVILGIISKNTMDSLRCRLTGTKIATIGIVLGMITIGFDILFMVACSSIIRAIL